MQRLCKLRVCLSFTAATSGHFFPPRGQKTQFPSRCHCSSVSTGGGRCHFHNFLMMWQYANVSFAALNWDEGGKTKKGWEKCKCKKCHMLQERKSPGSVCLVLIFYLNLTDVKIHIQRGDATLWGHYGKLSVPCHLAPIHILCYAVYVCVRGDSGDYCQGERLF